MGKEQNLLLSVEQITKQYTERVLLDHVSFGINEGDKIGVIGVNGAGKSTLLKIIAEKEEPDEGRLVKKSGLKTAYLPQNPVFEGERSVLEQALHHASRQNREAAEYECKAILNRLGVTSLSDQASLLSGGQKRRLSIACALVAPVDLLILDEPTNHIDNETIEWLEDYLKKYNGALLMITHDRYFLDRVTNKILELEHGQIYLYASNYSQYLTQRAQREEMLAASERKRQNLLKKELDWMMQGPKARSTKQRYRVERFEELSAKSNEAQQEELKFSSMSSRLGRKVIECKQISKQFGELPLWENFSYSILRRDRIGIVGSNGCGKSTLLKVLAGKLSPDSGEVSIGQTVKIGWFSQEGGELPPKQRVIDYINTISTETETPEGKFSSSQMLERFLFPAELQYAKIETLSGGERRRLALLGVIMQAPNLLLFDEPTNDLDTQTLMVLEEYLQEFTGAVIAVSHDRYFLDKIADTIFAFESREGKKEIIGYLGGYTDYITQRPERDFVQSKEKMDKGNWKQQQAAPKKLKFTFQENREYQQIDQKIAELEAKIAETESLLTKESSNYVRLEELTKQKEDYEEALSKQMERWVYLHDLAEKIANQERSEN